jgi:hypothetical protein
MRVTPTVVDVRDGPHSRKMLDAVDRWENEGGAAARCSAAEEPTQRPSEAPTLEGTSAPDKPAAMDLTGPGNGRPRHWGANDSFYELPPATDDAVAAWTLGAILGVGTMLLALRLLRLTPRRRG